MRKNPPTPTQGGIFGKETKASDAGGNHHIAAHSTDHTYGQGGKRVPMPAYTRAQKPAPEGYQLSRDLLDETIEVWQPYSTGPLTREDAREILSNVSGFFRVLRDWAEEDRRTSDVVSGQSGHR